MSYFDETLKDWVRTQQAQLGTTRTLQRVYTRRNNSILRLVGNDVNTKNLRAVKKALSEIDAKAKAKLIKLIEAQLADVANITIRNEAGNMEFLGITPSNKSFNTVGVVRKALNTPMQATNKTVKQVMNDVFGSSSEAATNIIRRSVTEGLTGAEVRRILKTRFTADSRYLATATATAMNSVANVARDEFYKANDDVIAKVMWRSTLDSRTSDICQSLDGKSWKVSEPHPSPPAHPNCRSFLVPVVKGISEDEAQRMTRPAVVDGEAKRVRAPTYGEWLGRQNKGFQEQVLGPRRAELLRKGDLSFDRFFTKDGKRLTIKQLEQKL